MVETLAGAANAVWLTDMLTARNAQDHAYNSAFRLLGPHFNVSPSLWKTPNAPKLNRPSRAYP